MSATARRPLHAVFLLLLALLFGGANLYKPLQIDDTAYYYFARQIAAHPLDPYGFSLLWYDEPSRANDILAPPVLPYTLAAGVRLFGEDPVAWKLLLLPWSLLLVAAVYALARRFAAGVELPLTALIVLSPALWPSLNLMLDVPALALTLAAVGVFLHACDAESLRAAALAGLLAGLAAETKYTGLVAPVVFLLAAVLRGRLRLGGVAVLTAVLLFCGWEYFTARRYGQSHFLNSLAQHGGDTSDLWAAARGLLLSKGPLVSCLFSLLGGVAPALLLLGLAALGVRRVWLGLLAGVILAGVLLIALFDAHFTGTVAPSARWFGLAETPPWQFEFADVIFGVVGGALFLVAGVAAWRLYRASDGDARRDTLFLLGWCALETTAYFPMTPFPAVRRVLGVFVVVSLLLGRLAAQSCRSRTEQRTLWGIALGGVALGAAFVALDFWSAAAARGAADRAAAWIGERGGGRVWYVGHWGFQYYAERHGMRPVVTEYAAAEGMPPPSRLSAGDWLVVPDGSWNQQALYLDPAVVREETAFALEDPLTLRTLPNFYGGPTALQHHEGPRLRVRIYRVLRDFTPCRAPPATARRG